MADQENDELQKIKDRIPEAWGKSISCGPGWDQIIIDLDRALAELDPDYVIHQVKEKFGGLRFYYDSERAREDPELARKMSRLVDEAEQKAERTCADTGNPGVLMVGRGHWYRTLDPVTAGAQFDVCRPVTIVLSDNMSVERLRNMVLTQTANLIHYATVLERLHSAYRSESGM